MKYKTLIDLLKTRSEDKAEERFIHEISTGTELTYAAFYHLVEDRAQFMKNRGLKAGDIVGLIYKNSIEFMADFFAVLKNGAIVTPMNAALKDRELNYIFQDVNLKYIVIESQEKRIIDLVDFLRIDSINKSTSFVTLNGHIVEDIRKDNLIKETALILHTSGSTGKPKGVF